MRKCAVQDMEKHVASLENARAALEAGLPIQFIYIMWKWFNTIWTCMLGIHRFNQNAQEMPDVPRALLLVVRKGKLWWHLPNRWCKRWLLTSRQRRV